MLLDKVLHCFVDTIIGQGENPFPIIFKLCFKPHFKQQNEAEKIGLNFYERT